MPSPAEHDAIRQRPHHVYRIYDADDTLLYVGCTVNLEQRLRQHHSKPWFPATARVDVVGHPNWAAGRLAERQAIRTEQPRHNRLRMSAAPTAYETETLARLAAVSSEVKA